MKMVYYKGVPVTSKEMLERARPRGSFSYGSYRFSKAFDGDDLAIGINHRILGEINTIYWRYMADDGIEITSILTQTPGHGLTRALITKLLEMVGKQGYKRIVFKISNLNIAEGWSMEGLENFYGSFSLGPGSAIVVVRNTLSKTAPEMTRRIKKFNWIPEDGKLVRHMEESEVDIGEPK